MYAEIGSFEAKTRLPELLRAVQQGQRFTITLRGEPIADLVPSSGAYRADVASAVAAMKQFMVRPAVVGQGDLSDEDLRHYRDVGRK